VSCKIIVIRNLIFEIIIYQLLPTIRIIMAKLTTCLYNVVIFYIIINIYVYIQLNK